MAGQGGNGDLPHNVATSYMQRKQTIYAYRFLYTYKTNKLALLYVFGVIKMNMYNATLKQIKDSGKCNRFLYGIAIGCIGVVFSATAEYGAMMVCLYWMCEIGRTEI